LACGHAELLRRARGRAADFYFAWGCFAVLYPALAPRTAVIIREGEGFAKVEEIDSA
jgi:hypothetical protein